MKVFLTILMFAVSTVAWAQETFLQGRVLDVNRKPLPNASVLVAGTNTGTLTDAAGNYALRLPAGLPRTAIIRFSLLGMTSFETQWGGRGTINATLMEAVTQIAEAKVVRTGIATLNANEYVGAHATITADSIMKPNFNSLDQMLQGEVAGLALVNTSMRAGAAPKITIRGQSTLLGTTEPLWVVDGIIQPATAGTTTWGDVTGDDLDEYLGSAISWLNPQDVETITILKDASATAIYGSRASNGVIVVTTKRGKADQLSVRANYNLTVGQQLNYGLYNLMNSQERINFSKEAFEQGAAYAHVPIEQKYTYEGMYRMYLNGRLSNEQFVQQYNRLETVNTDWLKLLTRPSLNQNMGVSATGGTQNVNYVASASYANQQATEKGNGSQRFTGRLGLDVKLSPKLRLATSIMGSMSKTTGFANSNVDPIGYATTTSRAIPAYEPDGSLTYYQVREQYKYNAQTEYLGLPYNVLDNLANVGSTIESPSLQGSLDFKWLINSDFTYQMVAGYTNTSRASESWLGENSFRVIQGFRGYRMGSDEALNSTYRDAAVLKTGGLLITDNLASQTYNIRNQLNYTKQLSDNHRLTAMAMWEVSSTKNTSKYNTVYGYDRAGGDLVDRPTVPSELKPIGGAKGPADYNDTYLNLAGSGWRSYRSTTNMASLAMIAAWSMHGKYIVNANFRNDWSNAFGQNANRRFNPAWSLGVSWRLGDEAFMESTRGWLSQANFRLTYGTQGNLSNTRTTEMILRYNNRHPLFDQRTSEIVGIANPWMTWERTQSWNGGFDLGLFNNRISVVLDGYSRLSNVGRNFPDIPENGGFNTILTGTYIRNSGIEASVSFTPLKTERWRVQVSANMGKNWSKIVREDETLHETYALTSYVNGQNDKVIVPGYPVGAFWAYPYAGPDPLTGIPTFHNFHYGSYTVEERSKSAIEQLQYMGTKIADITSGLNIRVSYGDFTLSTQMSATIGGKRFLPNPYSAFLEGKMPEAVTNLNKELLDRWTKDNTGSQIPGLYVVPNTATQPITIMDPVSGSNFMNIYTMWAQSNTRVASLSALRCQSMNLTWRVRQSSGKVGSWMRQAGIKNMDLSAGVNNLFLLVDKKWKGMDPELGGDRRMPRSVSFGINLGF